MAPLAHLAKYATASIAALVTLVALGCGANDGMTPGDDARSAIDAAAGGDSANSGTSVQGTWKGTPFVLTHAAFAAAEQLHTLCFSNVAITAPDCGYSDGQSKIVLYGGFVVIGEQSGWQQPIELRDIGSGQVELSSDASLTLSSFDASSGTVVGTLSATFGSGVSSGSVHLP